MRPLPGSFNSTTTTALSGGISPTRRNLPASVFSGPPDGERLPLVTARKTEKLYLNDPYTTSFRARVVEWNAADGDRASVVLDRTCFYPESGGQTADTGAIGPMTVLDVEEGVGELVRHLVDTSAVADAPEEGGEVELSTEFSQSVALIRVIDNGLGIPKEDIPYVFDKFYRIGTKDHMEQDGSGLGLSISKKVC